MDPELIDTVLYVAGAGVWLGAAAWLALRRRDPLRGAAGRPNRLDWMAVVWVVLIYFLATAVVAGACVWLLPGEIDDDSAGELTSACTNAASFLAAALACLWLGRRSFGTGLRGFGLSFHCLALDLRWAGLTILAVWPAVAAALWLSEQAVLSTLGREFVKNHRVIEALENDLPAWVVALLILTAVVVAPLAEEFFFRGILQTRLASALRSRWAAVALAAACFGLVHGGQIAAIVPLTLMGIILGFAYEASGSLIAPVLVHSLFNTKSLMWHYLHNAA